LHARLSLDTAYHRFFSAMRRLPPDWARMLATVDYHRRLALVVVPDPPTGDVIAVARYEPADRADTVEVAFVVEDRWQERGLGTVLLGDLLQAAGARGIQRFRAYVLADNRRMLDMLSRFTDVKERRIEAGVVDLVFTRRDRGKYD
jgi:RimJ/RimL family protein N-acetyltransferase